MLKLLVVVQQLIIQKLLLKPGEKGTVTATYNAANGGAFQKQLLLQQVKKTQLQKC